MRFYHRHGTHVRRNGSDIRGCEGEKYSLVDSLRTSLVQNGQDVEIDLEEVGALVELAE